MAHSRREFTIGGLAAAALVPAGIPVGLIGIGELSPLEQRLVMALSRMPPKAQTTVVRNLEDAVVSGQVEMVNILRGLPPDLELKAYQELIRIKNGIQS